MKVCFVGVGSIAIRHIRNIKKIFNMRKDELIIDICRSGNGNPLPEDIQKYIMGTYFGVENVKEKYDAIFITNPTEYHIKVLEKLKYKAHFFFVEKPVVSYGQLTLLDKITLDMEATCYVACPLRYKKIIQYIKNELDFNSIYSVRSISSSYLPDWRLGTDYRTTYSAHKDRGGGVAIDLIHEWDYLQYLFGAPNKIYSFNEKVSELEIDSDDVAIYIARYPHMTLELHLDYFGRESIRELQIFTKKDTIVCDLIRNEIKFLKARKTISFDESRDDFQMKELNYFINIVEQKVTNPNPIELAIKTLKLTAGQVERD